MTGRKSGETVIQESSVGLAAYTRGDQGFGICDDQASNEILLDCPCVGVAAIEKVWSRLSHKILEA
jgi:hypothetical protein